MVDSEQPILPTIDLVVERFQQHLIWAEQYVRRYNAAEPKSLPLRVNPRSLFLAIKSTYDDIYRYKAYHHQDPRSNLSNSVKRAAYLCKWFCRTKPIELASQPSTPTEADYDDITASLINGAFALYLARVHIGQELENPFFYSAQYLNEFQYDLLYRNLGDDGLLHIFQNIFTAVKVERAGVLEFVRPRPVASVFDRGAS